MNLATRDRIIVQWVARFKQLSSSQIAQLVFNRPDSNTSCDRALIRLVRDHYLHRVERRLVGGARSGSGQYVYALGRRGFYTFYDGRYSPARNVNFHSLAIADTFLTIRRLELTGHLTIVGLATEPDCHTMIARQDLRPDMLIELQRADGRRARRWLEIDMGTEGQKQVRAKLMRYWTAWQEASEEQWPRNQRIMWVAVDAERAKELTWLIEQLPQDARGLFSVTTIADVAGAIL